MELIEDWNEDSGYTFDEDFDPEVHGCDEDYISQKLDEKYPEDKYFVLVDYIDDRNCGYFHIRVWAKDGVVVQEDPKTEDTGFRTSKGEKIYDGDVFNNHGWSNVVIKKNDTWYVKYAGGTELLKNQIDEKFERMGNCVANPEKFIEEYDVYTGKQE